MLLTNGFISEPVDIQDNLLQDQYTWEGDQQIVEYFNLLTLRDLRLVEGGTAGTKLTEQTMLLPPVEKVSQVILTVQLVGKVLEPTSTSGNWTVQLKRADGTIVSTDPAVKIDVNSTVSLITYTIGLEDPSSIEGLQLGIFNNTKQTIDLTAVRVLVQRTVNQT